MIIKLTPDIWWGDKPSIAETRGEVSSIINVAHAIRRPYWQDVGRLDWRVWYFRLALPDREPVDVDYLLALDSVIDAINQAEQFPLLCHCRAGGHRGPAAAFYAAYRVARYGDKSNLRAKIRGLKPGFFKFHPKRIYRNTMLHSLGLLER